MSFRIDPVLNDIYRISTFSPEIGITFNQFLIVDEQPALIHTGTFPMYEGVRRAIEQVMDPAKVPGVMYLLPCGKSPHGVDVDPSGQYVICSGKLQPTSTVLQTVSPSLSVAVAVTPRMWLPRNWTSSWAPGAPSSSPWSARAVPCGR